MSLTHLSLFSGIGGLDLAAEWAGFETVGQCEFADYPYKVLEKHWPDVPKWRDVHGLTAADFTARTGLETVDCISGGFPCQPHSVAGKRKASADERDLWPEYRRIIGEIKPRWVVAENVPGLLSSEDGRFFRGILRDFADMGFDVGWATFPASWVGATHRRERIFTIANANSRTNELLGIGKDNGRGEQKAQKWRENWNEFELVYGKVAPSQWRESGGDSEPFICRKSDGISAWMDRWHCLGNAVCPQQAHPVFKAIWEIEHET